MSVNAVNSDGSLLRVAGGTLYADLAVGSIVPFGGSAIPSGYLLCNGAEVLKTAYAELYAVIGDAFGTASDNTKFKLPDLREAVPVGSGTRGSGVADHDTYAVGQFKDDQLQDHDHKVKRTGLNGGTVMEGIVNWSNGDPAANTSPASINTTTRTGTTTHGKQLGVNYIIKAKQVAMPFDMAEYIRNQNILSDYEDITLPTTAATAITMPYDGVYILANYGVSDIHHIYLNGIEISAGITGNSTTGASTSSTILFKKGDTMYRLNTYTDSTFVEHVAYYKLRDYTGR